jgi:hypothetical protein
MRNIVLALGLLMVAGGLAAGQDKKRAEPGNHPGVDAKRVKRAIDRGIEFLKTSDSPGHNQSKDADELILLTFVHAGAEAQPRFKELFDKMMSEPLSDTYSVALQAMVLEEVDRVRYQGRIHQCAQFLVDNQCKNGQWSYGTPTTYPDAIPVPKGDVPTGLVRTPKKLERGTRNFDDAEAGKQKPRVVQHLAVKKNRDGPAAGDNSNSQYAALGIRACHEAGIVFPREVLETSRKYWLEDQEKGDNKDAVATGGVSGIPRGWGYGKAEEGKCYGSMTAGAIGALCIYDFILGIEFKKDKGVQDGIAWLGKNFIPNNNPGRPNWFHYYYLYGAERAGMLADVTHFGAHDWYLEGANLLLDQQQANGSWGTDDKLNPPSWGTCFAVLFLKQATRRLDVASTDSKR